MVLSIIADAQMTAMIYLRRHRISTRFPDFNVKPQSREAAKMRQKRQIDR
jgi:hypothetical protein